MIGGFPYTKIRTVRKRPKRKRDATTLIAWPRQPLEWQRRFADRLDVKLVAVRSNELDLQCRQCRHQWSEPMPTKAGRPRRGFAVCRACHSPGGPETTVRVSQETAKAARRLAAMIKQETARPCTVGDAVSHAIAEVTQRRGS